MSWSRSRRGGSKEEIESEGSKGGEKEEKNREKREERKEERRTKRRTKSGVGNPKIFYSNYFDVIIGAYNLEIYLNNRNFLTDSKFRS